MAVTRDRRSAFTLLELLVVLTLMSLAVSTLVLGLDGVTQRGRLRAAATQLTCVVRMTRAQARMSGTPRLLQYDLNGSHVSVRAPKKDGATWGWSKPQRYVSATRVSLMRVLVEGDQGACDEGGVCTIRVDPDGRIRSHAIILKAGEAHAAVCLGSVRATIHLPLDREPVVGSYDALVLELAQHHEKPS